ncbi:hypothetical protein [Neptuniibacter sp. QD37_11]|uniref:hypothetical protein n=1 Tax=Neptuniibacter sp. QD37_11 TaxID=3398209 RepID=UPI0039F5F6BC
MSKKDELSFEQAYVRLQEIANLLESKLDVKDLDRSVELLKEKNQLVEFLRERIVQVADLTGMDLPASFNEAN